MSNNSFTKFNLIPTKTKDELVSLEERDNSVLYAAILIFFAVLIFAVFTVGKTLLVDTRKTFLESSLAKLDTQIDSYTSIKKLNGELYIKSNALSPIVEQDIKLTELIDVANKLVENSVNVLITSYSRELDGKFAVSIEMENYSDINTILANAEKIDILEEFFIETMNKPSEDAKVSCTVSFILTNLS